MTNPDVFQKCDELENENIALKYRIKELSGDRLKITERCKKLDERVLDIESKSKEYNSFVQSVFKKIDDGTISEKAALIGLRMYLIPKGRT